MPKKAAPKVSVSERALTQRINRKLKQDGEVLRRATAANAASIGDYFIVDLTRNSIASQRVNPERLARELGVLKPWEELREC